MSELPPPLTPLDQLLGITSLDELHPGLIQDAINWLDPSAHDGAEEIILDFASLGSSRHPDNAEWAAAMERAQKIYQRHMDNRGDL